VIYKAIILFLKFVITAEGEDEASEENTEDDNGNQDTGIIIIIHGNLPDHNPIPKYSVDEGGNPQNTGGDNGNQDTGIINKTLNWNGNLFS
jgi:hypothetical protein